MRLRVDLAALEDYGYLSYKLVLDQPAFSRTAPSVKSIPKRALGLEGPEEGYLLAGEFMGKMGFG